MNWNPSFASGNCVTFTSPCLGVHFREMRVAAASSPGLGSYHKLCGTVLRIVPGGKLSSPEPILDMFLEGEVAHWF